METVKRLAAVRGWENYSLWYYNGRYMSLYIYQNLQDYTTQQMKLNVNYDL